MDPARGRQALPGGPTAREEVAQEGVSVAGEDRLRMELHALDRTYAVAEAHDEAVRGACCDLQTLRQGLSFQHEAVVAAYGHGLRQTREEPAPVMVNRCLMTMHRLSAHHPPTEVFTDRLMTQADPQDGQLLGCQSEALHRGARKAGVSRPRSKEEPGRLHGLNRGPIGAVRAHDLDLCAKFLEELGEVEGEGVPVVEDYDHWGQDAQRSPSRKPKGKKPLSGGSCLAGAHPWNKVPG